MRSGVPTSSPVRGSTSSPATSSSLTARTLGDLELEPLGLGLVLVGGLGLALSEDRPSDQPVHLVAGQLRARLLAERLEDPGARQIGPVGRPLRPWMTGLELAQHRVVTAVL